METLKSTAPLAVLLIIIGFGFWYRINNSQNVQSKSIAQVEQKLSTVNRLQTAKLNECHNKFISVDEKGDKTRALANIAYQNCLEEMRQDILRTL